MKRQVLAFVCVAFSLFAATSIFAQTVHKTEDTERIYVIVEITGLEVSCTQFSSQNEVNTHIADLKKENGTRAVANKPILDEVKKLNTDLATKKRALANAKDDAKEALQKEIDDLTAQIAQKTKELKPMTTWRNPQHFSKRADADKFIEGIYKQAQAEKEKAAQRQAEEEKKKAEENK